MSHPVDATIPPSYPPAPALTLRGISKGSCLLLGNESDCWRGIVCRESGEYPIAGVAEASRDTDPAFGVPDSSSVVTSILPSAPSSTKGSPAPGSARLPFLDVGTEEDVELGMESDGVVGEGEERENGIVVISPMACALRIVFLA